MSFDLERLYSLLPAIYRIRDIEQGDAEQGGPLKALLSVLAEEVAGLEDNLTQLYEDQFIETCAEWVVPYIGDLLGVHGLQSGLLHQRAFVAHTLGYRRRKGTAVGLEQVARDITGWPAHVVEFFQLLATTQSMHHIRLQNLATPDLRQWKPLERLGTPFDPVAHTVDVHSISSGRGRYNIPNIGIFLWRLQAYRLTNSPAFQVDELRYKFSPLGNDMQLFTHPTTEEEFLQLAAPGDVPMPISRRILDAYLDAVYYGENRSLFLKVNEENVPGDGQQPSQRISICNLSNSKDASGSGWIHMPKAGGKIAIDPVLGRIAFPPDAVPGSVHVTFHYGFSMDMGGGEYERTPTFDASLHAIQQIPKPYATIQDALNTLSGSGVVEIQDSGLYTDTFSLHATRNQSIELRAANRTRPALRLSNDIQITGDEGAEVTLNGLLISGSTLQVSGRLQRLRLLHCTLVPERTLSIGSIGSAPPPSSAPPSLVLTVETGYPITVEIDHCITGPLLLPSEGVTLIVRDSIIDALPSSGQASVAIAASKDGQQPGPVTTIEHATILGNVYVKELTLASATIFMYPVKVDRQQIGCVRFSYLADGSRTPRRYQCQPDLASQQAVEVALKVNPLLSPGERQKIIDAIHARLKPSFTQENYGEPAYAQLTLACPIEIRTGADDGAEMAAFHDLYQPQREADLRSHLDEFLRFNLTAGILYAT